jgi:hypothetical protein
MKRRFSRESNEKLWDSRSAIFPLKDIFPGKFRHFLNFSYGNFLIIRQEKNQGLLVGSYILRKGKEHRKKKSD